MADEPKVVVERTYNVNLRRKVIGAPAYKRAKKTVNALKTFARHHFKVEEVKLSQGINQLIWSRGIKNPVVKFEFHGTKYDNDSVSLRLVAEDPSKVKESKRQAHIRKFLQKREGDKQGGLQGMLNSAKGGAKTEDAGAKAEVKADTKATKTDAKADIKAAAKPKTPPASEKSAEKKETKPAEKEAKPASTDKKEESRIMDEMKKSVEAGKEAAKKQ